MHARVSLACTPVCRLHARPCALALALSWVFLPSSLPLFLSSSHPLFLSSLALPLSSRPCRASLTPPLARQQRGPRGAAVRGRGVCKLGM
eukprot:3146673-Rhodomonas_salina.1